MSSFAFRSGCKWISEFCTCLFQKLHSFCFPCCPRIWSSFKAGLILTLSPTFAERPTTCCPHRNMGLRRDDLRPLQQLLRAELANLHAGVLESNGNSVRIPVKFIPMSWRYVIPCRCCVEFVSLCTNIWCTRFAEFVNSSKIVGGTSLETCD